MAKEPNPPAIAPLFIGGTGRSGTTITAQLLNSHRAVAASLAELRFPVRKNGLCDLLAGSSSLDTMLRLARTADFRRRARHRVEDHPEMGVFELIERKDWDELLAGFSEQFGENPEAAAATLVRGVLDPIARRAGARAWVDHTPENAIYASILHRVFPDLRMIVCLRDGRDVATSIVPLPWGPDEPVEALRWWGARVLKSHHETSTLPPAQVHVVRLEELAIHRRDTAVEALLAFLDLSIENERELATFVGSGATGDPPPYLSADRAHAGRWMETVDASARDEFCEIYRGIIELLRREGAALPWGADDLPQLDGEVLEQRVLEQHQFMLERQLAGGGGRNVLKHP